MIYRQDLERAETKVQRSTKSERLLLDLPHRAAVVKLVECSVEAFDRIINLTPPATPTPTYFQCFGIEQSAHGLVPMVEVEGDKPDTDAASGAVEIFQRLRTICDARITIAVEPIYVGKSGSSTRELLTSLVASGDLCGYAVAFTDRNAEDDTCGLTDVFARVTDPGEDLDEALNRLVSAALQNLHARGEKAA